MLLAALLTGWVAAARAQAPAPADPLAESLLAHVSFAGTAEERVFFEMLTRRVLESPTARELAAEVLASPLPVSARFADLPGTQLYERRGGRVAFDATEAGRALRARDGVVVELNRACLRIDPEYARVDCARHLAHELFGHALGLLRASSAEDRALYLYYDDEYEARLVGWIVTVELAGQLLDPEPACALADPAAYRKRLQRTYPSSSASLSLEELSDPLAAWRGRASQGVDAKGLAWTRESLSYFEGEGAASLPRLTAAARDAFFAGLPERARRLEGRLSSYGDRLFTIGDCSDYR